MVAREWTRRSLGTVRRFWVETLGCPKNQVDSDKITGLLARDGMAAADAPEEADLVVVNTCAFIEEARQESVDTVLALRSTAAEAELVVTGCMAERYGGELAEALPEIDRVAGFGVPVSIGAKPVDSPRSPVELPEFDLLNLPRPPAEAPWAYVKIAEDATGVADTAPFPASGGPSAPGRPRPSWPRWRRSE